MSSFAAAVLALLGIAPGRLPASKCESLAQLRLEAVTITSARVVPAGTFVMPGGTGNAPPEFFTAFDRLPAFCRVQAVAHPTPDSDIGIEVWLPDSGWNGRYLGVGNGSYGGSLNYYRLGEALNLGYAASSTDTGHRGAPRDTEWAVGHPEKQIDFDYRAVHETAVTARALIHAFHGTTPRHSYFSSCSNGGRQGLMEAERYPTDYDGIFAGAPGIRDGFMAYISGQFAAFAKRGGKIVIYHGGNDSPAPSIGLFDTVSQRMGGVRLRDFMQLYVIPGMGHCGSGDEPNDVGQWLRPNSDPQHSLFKALERWVEGGVRPTGVIARRFVRDGDATSGIAKTRLLCPYGRDSTKAARHCPP